MASQAQIKARENIMNIRRKREEEENSSRFSYSENEDPMTVARRNISTIRGKQLTDNTSRLDSLRKSAEERRIRQEALNKYKRIAGTDNAEEVKRIGSVGQALDERIQRSMGVKGDRIGSERLERAVALDRMKKSTAEKDALEKDTQYYKRLLTDDSQMDASTRRQALEKLKRTIMTEQISGDSKTLSDLSKSFSNATGKKVSQTDAYQMLENAQGQIDRDKYDQKMGEKRKELEKVLDEKGFETAAKKGSQIAQKKTVYNADMLAGYQNEDKSYPDIFKSQTEYEQYQDMTDTEKDVFDYYLATEGVQKAKEYLNTIKRDITKRQNEAYTEKMKQYATEHPTLSSESSVAAGFATGLGALETMRQNAENVLTGNNAPVDINSKPFRPANAQSTIRNTVMENFQGSEDVKALKRFLYQTGMSMADFGTQAAAGALVGGFAGEAASLAGASAERAAQITATISKNASLPIMGAGAMSQTVKEVIENGGTNDQAMQLGLIAGAAEMVTERLGIDNLSKLSSQGVNSVKRAVHKIIAEGAIPEGLEEVVSDIVNNVANDAIMQENSDFNQAVERYMTPNAMTGEHISRRQAEDLAMKDRIKNMALSFAGGALSGGIMAAGAYGSGYIEGGKTGRALNEYYGISDETLINNAKALEGTNAKELAEYHEGKGKLTDRKKAELYNQILKDTKGEYIPSPEITQNETEITQNKTEDTQTGEGIAQEARPVELTAEDLQEPQIDAQAKEKKAVQENVRQREKVPETGAQRSVEGVNYKGLQGDIEGIDRVENGKIYARVNTGDATIVQPVSNLNFDNAVTQALYQTAEGYKDAGARNFVMEYNGESLIAYKKGFNAYYDAATVGIPMRKVNSVYGNMLTERQKAAAYTAGETDLNFEQRYENLKVARETKTAGSQVLENDAFRSLTKENQTILKAYAKMSGANVVVDETISAGNGRYANGYYDNNGTIHIAADATSPISVVANHELTHYLQQYSPIYDEYKKEVINYLMQKENMPLDGLIERHMSNYENAGRQISREEAMDEIVANASEMFLTDESAVQQMVRENRSIGEKVLDFFKEFISNLKKMLAGYEPKSKEAQMLNEDLEVAQKAEKIWLEAMQSAKEAGKKAQENTVTGGEIKKSFSLKEDVEETKDLIAVHNITEDKLNKQLELEGFPMISIAVTKTDIGHSNFGDITAVFKKDTIDPANKKNKVYSADAWTPTFPRIEYEVNYKEARIAQEKLNRIADEMNREFEGRVRSFANGLEYNLDSYGGYEGTVQRALNDDSMKAAYLTDKGENVGVEYKETRTEMKEVDKEISQKLIDVFGDEIDDIAKGKGREIVQKHGEQIRKALLEYYTEQGIDEETAKSVVDATTGLEIANSVRKAKKFKENGGVEVKREEDWKETKKKIDDRINESDYEKWVRDIFGGIEEKSGLWNGKDPFTPSGNRRSFESTHYPYNAENIVKAMLAQNDSEKNVVGFQGIKTVRAAAADEFKSIADIKKNEGRLQTIDTEEYNEKVEKLEGKLYGVMAEIVGDENNLFEHMNKMDHVGELILDAAKKPTEANVKKILTKYGHKVTDAQAKEISDVIKEIKKMPVNMFEAKPQRVVGYDEVAYWILPDNTSEETRKRIEKASETAPILEYKKGDENQRKNIINSLNDVKFSLKEDKKITEFADEIEDIINKKGTIPNWKKIDVGTVTDSEASAIKSVIGIDTKGWKKKWSADDMAHLIERHGKNGEADKTMKNNSDIGKTNAVILGFDEIREGIGSKKYKNSDHTPAKTVLFLKNEAGDIWNVIEVVPDAKAKTIWIQSAYKKRGDASSLIQNMPQADVRNEKGLPLTMNINDSGEKVNKKDIRYQMEDASEVDYDTLKAENKDLKELNSILGGMIKATKGIEPDQEAIKKVGKKILKDYNSDYNLDTFTRNMTGIWKYISGSKNIDAEQVAIATADMAKGILEHAKVNVNERYAEQYKDLAKEVRQIKLEVPEEMRGDFDREGGYAEFRKRNFGTLKLGKEGQSIDSYYQSLAERYPELFDETIYTNPADQLMHIAEVMESIKPKYENAFGMDLDEAAADLAHEIYQSYFDIAAGKGSIDSIRKNVIEKERLKYKKYREKMRDDYKKYREEYRGNFAQRRKENFEKKAYSKNIEQTANRLSRWLLNPTNTNSVPESLRGPVAEFLNSINLSSKDVNVYGNPTQRTLKWQALSRAYENIIKAQDKSEYTGQFIDLDPDLVNMLNDLTEKNKEVMLADMTVQDMKELNRLITAVKKSIESTNTLLATENYKRVSDLGEKFLEENEKKESAKESVYRTVNTARNFMKLDMLDSRTYFNSLGKAGMDIYGALRSGLDKKTRNIKIAHDYIKNLMGETDISEWSGDKAKLHEFETEGREELKLTTAQVMSLYRLLQRDQAKKHILEGGIRPEKTITKAGKLKKEVTRYYEPIRVTEKDLLNIIDTLTPEQKRIADGITDFFTSTTSAWGNEVSMQLYGYRKFMARNYFPIVSDNSFTNSASGDQQGNVQTLKNMGSTKATVPHAGNPIILQDIFDVYARQSDQMASYNAFVVPLTDLQKWYNYRGDPTITKYKKSVKQTITRTMGQNGRAYLDTLVRRINGAAEKETAKQIWSSLTSNMKSAAIGANLRVVLQQPTAIVRAATVIDAKYLMKGMAKKADGDQMKKYAPIAQWKDWGYFEMDTGRQMKDVILGKESLKDKAMAPAGMADDFTWGKIWNAVLYETKDKTDLKPGSEEFYQAAGKRFSEIIDRTQVVDSILHRSSVMIQKDNATKMATSFMSEPIKTYNMVYDTLMNTPGGKKEVAKSMAKLLVILTIQNAVNALAQTLADVWRDDDDETAWVDVETWKDNFKDNMNPLTYIPYLKEIPSIWKGYTSERTEMTGITDSVQGLQKWIKYFQGESKYTAAGLVRESMKPISELSGMPINSTLREFESLADLIAWNYRKVTGNETAKAEYEIKKTFYRAGNPKNRNMFIGLYGRAREEGDYKTAAAIYNDLQKAGNTKEKLDNAYKKWKKKRDEGLLEADEGLQKEITEAYKNNDMETFKSASEELKSKGIDINTALNQIEDEEKEEEEYEVSEVTPEDLQKEDNTAELYTLLYMATQNNDAQAQNTYKKQLKEAGEKEEDFQKNLLKEQNAKAKATGGTEYSYDALFNALVSTEGKNGKKYKEIEQGLKKYGKDDSTIKKSMKSRLKTAYLNSRGNDRLTKKYSDLLRSFGVDTQTIKGWLK